MSQNALKFEEFLKTKNITLEKTSNDDLTSFLIREQIGAPSLTTIGLLFNNNDDLATIVAYQFLKINKVKKKPQIMELINTLNAGYTFLKYVAKDDFVTLHISMPFKDNFSAELLNELIFSLINALKRDYPQFMEILEA